jgi:predicted TIM-barrel fold metal-dependent hydrolase
MPTGSRQMGGNGCRAISDKSQSNPGQLESMIAQYRNISFVILHAYPFISEATYLARTNPNVWVDTSWLVLQSPEILKTALKEYIGMVPADRIFSSIDSISLEEYAGGIALTRSILIDVLSEKVESDFLDIEEALYIAERVLGGNCKQLHRL